MRRGRHSKPAHTYGSSAKIFGINIGGSAKAPARPRENLPFPIANVIAGIPQAFYPETSFKTLVNIGFKRNSLVFRALSIKAAAFASAPLVVYSTKDDSEQPNHALKLLLDRPNPWQSGFEFREAGCLSLDLSGNYFVFKWRENSRQVRQLVQLRSDRISLLVSDSAGLVGYKYGIGGREMTIPREDIIHIKLGNPEEIWFGYPPIQAALTKIASDNEATDFQKALLQNQAVPRVAVTTKADKLTADQLKVLKATWKAGYGGENRGKTAFLSEGMDIKVISLNMQELDFSGITEESARRIIMAFGIPPEMVGMHSETFANFEEGRKAFYQDTIEPLQNRFDDWIDIDLASEFGGGVYTRFDTSDLAAYETIRNSKIDSAYRGVVSGVVSVNEARAIAKLPPMDGGDVFLRPLMQSEVAATPLPVTGRKSHSHEITTKAAVDSSARARAAVARRDAIAKMMHIITGKAVTEFKLEAIEILTALGKALPGAEFKATIVDPENMRAGWRERIIKNFLTIMEPMWLQAAQMGLGELGPLPEGVDFNLANDAVKKFVSDYVYKFADKISQTSADEVQSIILAGQDQGWSVAELSSKLQEAFGKWTSQRSSMVALTESMRAASHGAAIGWNEAGVVQKEWLTTMDDIACDYCLSLNGSIVGTMDDFIPLGGEIAPDAEGVAPMKITYDAVGGGDAHPFCRCVIMPVLEGI